MGQSTHPLQHGGHFIHGAFRSLGNGDAVVGVAVALIQAVDLGGQTVGDLQTRRIVLGAVDAQAGGQTSVGGIQRFGAVHHVTLSVER
ncbi:hypothetical protein D3C85_1302380 [compost metagenome]